MNTIQCKWLLPIAILSCSMIASFPLAAKKPPKPPPDPCTSNDVFSPDYVFWRDTGTRRDPKVTIFLAESHSDCERELLDISTLETGPVVRLHEKFSYIIHDGVQIGRVVWVSIMRSEGNAVSVSKYDFMISGNVLIEDGGAVEFMVNEDLVNQDIHSIDLSPDTGTLVFNLSRKDPGTGEWMESIRILDIDSCLDAPSPCHFDDERSAVVAEAGLDVYYHNPAWGPLGSRIYAVRGGPGTSALEALDLVWDAGELAVTSRDLLSSSDYPELEFMRRGISTMVGDDEILAVENPPTWWPWCANIHLVNVGYCESTDDTDCLSSPEFSGIFSSWNREGKLMHIEQRPVTNKKGTCAQNSIGLWDGSEVQSLLKGNEPNAAGGLMPE